MTVNKIFLVGFRTTGKSTIGKVLADKLRWSFLDMDFLITQEAGQDVDVLTNNGTDWRRFRKIENEVLYEIHKTENIVVSCGGGVGVSDVVDEITKKTFGQLNREILDTTKDSLIVLLTSSEEGIKDRLKRQYKNKKIMPFLNEEKAKISKNEKDIDFLIKELIEDSIATYQQRMPLYNELTEIKIDTSARSLKKTAEEIIKYVK